MIVNNAEAAELDRIRIACQRLYNAALEQRRDAYCKQGKTVSRYTQQKELTELRAAEPEYNAVAAVILRSPLVWLERAYRAFFRRVKQGGAPGFPRFRSRDRYDSFSFPRPVVSGALLQIPALGGIRLRLYRPLKGKPLEAHIRKTAKGWEASIVCDVGDAPAKVAVETSTGIDVGLNRFSTFADGSETENPRFYRKSETVLAGRSRRLQRKKRGSNSRRTAKRLVGAAHAKIRHQRLDFTRKLAKETVTQYDLIAIEDLNIRGLARTRLAKSVTDAAWGLFAACLNFKAEEAGKTIVAVDPRGTSQRCSRCSEKVPKTLSERWHNCPRCGLSIGRDHNAAINIHALGLSAVSRSVAKAADLAEAS